MNAISTMVAPMTRNHATVPGLTSSKSDMAMTAPVYCEMPEKTNRASGENRSSRFGSDELKP